MEETPPKLEREIAEIEQKLAEKKQELNRETLYSVVQEKIQEHISDYQPVAPSDDSAVAPPPVTEPLVHLPDEFKNKVQELVNIAFNESLDTAFKALKQTGNPALIDAFHDVLVDQLYDVLVERGKLKKV